MRTINPYRPHLEGPERLRGGWETIGERGLIWEKDRGEGTPEKGPKNSKRRWWERKVLRKKEQGEKEKRGRKAKD